MLTVAGGVSGAGHGYMPADKVAPLKAKAVTKDPRITTQRVIAYYEGETDHPPTTLLPQMAEALGVTADELLGLKAPRKSKTPDARLQRRLQQIERMPARERRQILQLLDTFIEHAQLKQKADA